LDPIAQNSRTSAVLGTGRGEMSSLAADAI
jgi:hypothetical protein